MLRFPRHVVPTSKARSCQPPVPGGEVIFEGTLAVWNIVFQSPRERLSPYKWGGLGTRTDDPALWTDYIALANPSRLGARRAHLRVRVSPTRSTANEAHHVRSAGTWHPSAPDGPSMWL